MNALCLSRAVPAGRAFRSRPARRRRPAGSRHDRSTGWQADGSRAAGCRVGRCHLWRPCLGGVDERWRACGARACARGHCGHQLCPDGIPDTARRAEIIAWCPLLPGHSSIAGGPAAAQGRADWLPVLSALDTIRSRAFATGDVASLDLVYARGSSVLSEDRRRLGDLRSVGMLARGLRPALVAARRIRAEPGTVVLEVRDRLPPYTIVDRDGGVLEWRPGRAEETWEVTIVPAAASPGQWRISSIRLAD
jgi:hypothetical protein